MFRVSLAAACLALATSTPAEAADLITLRASGFVTSTQSGAPGEIAVQDQASITFDYDSSSAVLGAVLAGGGGTSSVYSVELSNLNLAIGAYSFFSSTVSGNLYYQDDVFGQDAFGFVFHDPIGGPFGSSFANIQLQFRSPSTASLNSTGIGNGLPTANARTDLLVTFGGGAFAEARASDLTISAVAASAVPEPTAWLMMLLGFLAVGIRVRSLVRERSYSAAAATLQPAT